MKPFQVEADVVQNKAVCVQKYSTRGVLTDKIQSPVLFFVLFCNCFPLMSVAYFSLQACFVDHEMYCRAVPGNYC